MTDDDAIAQGPVRVASDGQLALARGRLVFDPQSCRTCRVCEVACSIVHEGIASPSLARLNIHFYEFEPENPVSAMICRQCEDAPCMAACPADAMTRDAHTGAVVILDDLCVGCMQCQDACKWHVPKHHPARQVAIKCDLCAGLARGPACVEFCPVAGRALRYEPEYYAQGGSNEGT